MLTKGINFVNFKIKKNSNLVKKNLKSILKSKNEEIKEVSDEKKLTFENLILKKIKKN